MLDGNKFLQGLVFYSLVKQAARQSAYKHALLKLAQIQEGKKPKFPTAQDVILNRPLNAGFWDIMARSLVPSAAGISLMLGGERLASQIAERAPKLQSAWLKRMAQAVGKRPIVSGGIVGVLGGLGTRALMNALLSRRYELQDF